MLWQAQLWLKSEAISQGSWGFQASFVLLKQTGLIEASFGQNFNN
jgi:hypothetical protein